MARLPIDLMTSTDRGDLPSGKLVVEKANAADFGGQIGSALTDLSKAGEQLAGKLVANAKKIQDFDYEKQFLQLQEQDNTAYQEKMRGISGDAGNHWTGSREETKARYDTWLKNLPPVARAEYEVRAQSQVAARTKQAFNDQFTQQDANTRLTLSESQRQAGLQVQQNPATYEQFVAQQEALIDKSPLTPLEKATKKAELKNALAVTAEAARAQQNPAAVIAEGVGGGFREALRKKESGGNDSVKSATSSAAGRYQYITGTWNGFAGRVGVPAVTPENNGTASDPRKNPAYQEKVLDAHIADSTAKLSAAKLPVTDANLYMLHFMGAGGGVEFLRKLQQDPNATAATIFPTEAAANRSVFFARNEPRTVQEVYGALTRSFNGGGTTASARPGSAASNLSADQNATVQEVARRSLLASQAAEAAANEAALSAKRNQGYLDLKEGPAPEATYKALRQSGVLRDFDDIQKAEGIMRARDKADSDFNTGVTLLQGGRAVANGLDKAHRDGIDAVYERGIKGGGDPAALAAAVFDKTGIVPPKFATAIRGALISEDAGRVGSALVTSSDMMRQNPNAFAGVEGRGELEKAAIEYNRLTGPLGMSSEQATKKIMADARNPDLLNPVKQEQLSQFRKDKLSQDKIDARLRSTFASGVLGFGKPELPTGDERTAMASIYSEFATEGFEQFRDPDKALAFADMRVQQQFGTQNGVLMRYPPDKAGLPKLPNVSNGHAWINEQAAKEVEKALGIVVDPSQVMLVPVERKGVSTSAAFKSGQPVRVQRDDGKNPGERTSYSSVPYSIMVMPKTPDQSVQVVSGAFFPDIETYVADKNKAAESYAAANPLTGYDQFGIPYEVPMHAAEQLMTPEQQRRKANAAEQEAARAASKTDQAAKTQGQARVREMLDRGAAVRGLSAPAPRADPGVNPFSVR